MPPPQRCPEHTGIEARLDEHERWLVNQDSLIQRIFEKIDILVEQTKKPGWTTTIIISLLTFLLGGALTVIGILMRRL